MKNEISVFISYKASGGRIEKFDDFKSELKNNYLCVIRPYPETQAMGLFDFLVDIILNSSLEEFIRNVVVTGLQWDLIKLGGKSLFLKPLLNAFSKIEKSNFSIDYARITFRFDDADIIIYYPQESLTLVTGKIFNELAKDFSKISTNTKGEIYQIHIPVIYENSDGEKFVVEEMGGMYEDYLLFWGVSYQLGFETDVWDIKNKKFLNKEWSYPR